jgi:hypothetical protein
MIFATLEDIKNTNDPVITVTDFDEVLSMIMAGLGEVFSKHCNRKFIADTYTELFEGGGEYLFLGEPPIRQINGIWVDESADWDDDDPINASDYLLMDAENGQLWSLFFTVKPSLYRAPAIKVEYDGGYDAVDSPADFPIPDDLKWAFVRQVQYDLKRRKDMGIATVTFKDGNVIKQPLVELLPQVESVLQRYRIPNI